MRSFVPPITRSMVHSKAMLMAGGIPSPGSMSSGPAMPIPNRSQLDAYNVNRDGWEGISQCLYDRSVYLAAGQAVLTYFTVPVGQGTGIGGGAKTLSDTNMTSAGQMPANQEFLIQSLEVLFEPAVPSVAAANPSAFGAQAVAASVNDAWVFYRAGNLNLFIGAKSYCQEAPLMKFPPKANFKIDAALADVSTAGASFQSRIAYASAIGRPYLLKAWLRLVSNQNFNVTLNWPEGVAAITNPASVVVSLDGIFYRRSQ